MNDRVGLTRRGFVRAALSIAVCGGVSVAFPEILASTGSATCPALPAILERLRGSCALGRAYLEEQPKERDEDFLFEAVFDGLDCTTASDEEIGRHLRERSRRDFEKGETVQVSDWILSRTEARLFALAEMLGCAGNPAAG